MWLRAEIAPDTELTVAECAPDAARRFGWADDTLSGTRVVDLLAGILPVSISHRVVERARTGGEAFYPRCRFSDEPAVEWFSLDCRPARPSGILLTFGPAVEGLPWTGEVASLLRAMNWFPWSAHIHDQSGRLIGVDAAFVRASGLTLDRLGDYNILSDPAYRREDLAGLLKRVFEGEMVRFDAAAGALTRHPLRLFESAGRVFYPAWGFPMLDEQADVRAVVMWYDDARLGQDLAYQTSEERAFASEIIETADALIVCLDTTGRITAFNPRCEETTGWKKEEVLGSFIWDILIPARYHGKIHEVFDDLVRGNPAYLRMQNPWLTRDGHERMISWHNAFHHGADGQIDRITAVGIDITDQTRMEQQLRESEERYRSVTENLLTGVFIYQDDRFVYCNARVEEILGLHRDLIIGRPVWEVTHPDDREMIRDRAKRRQQGEAGLPTHYSFRVIHSSGETRWLEMTVTTMDYLGRRAILGNVVDITERRAAEAERDALRRRLEQTQRMEALATLVGGIAHDFNNLLVGMMAGTSDVLAQTEPDDPRFKPLGDILQISRRAKDLVSQLLTVGSRGPAAMTRLDINEVIQEALRFVRPTLDPAITLQLSLSSQPATVLGDHNQLWQALTNLCLNARDAMPEGGVLAVTSEVDGDRILVCVSDTGKGIPLEIKERVFEPFFTTKPRGMGIGLGLAVTYGAITNHGGSIDVQDRPGGGTMFRIQLNRLTVAPETTTPSVVAEGDRAGKHTILVVDDEDGVRHVVSRILAREGHIVLTAGNGDETLDTLSRVGSNLQLVILDLELPGRSGAEIFADIRRVLPDTRILLTSGQPPGPAAKRLLAEGAVGFLQKPYDLWELRRAVKSAIGASSSSE